MFVDEQEQEATVEKVQLKEAQKVVRGHRLKVAIG